jgi:beta,beta-carotene 9',10'-dioxygenase
VVFGIADGGAPVGNTDVNYAAGFTSLDSEISIDELPVTGVVPQWLSGELFRNGPAKFETSGQRFRHWFDGLAMVHRFAFDSGTVSYRNRFLETPAYQAARDNGTIEFADFATDPCRSMFARFFTWYRRFPAAHNACVNVVPMDGGLTALTETPIAVHFERDTLATVGLSRYDDAITGNVTTAHPHLAPLTGDLVNYVLKFGRTCEYGVYRQDPKGMTRELIAAVPETAPSYMHSFAITENHVILVAFPYVVNPLALLLKGKPFISNYRWRPELGTRFVVIDQRTGEVRSDHRTDAFFAFHHINAFEQDGEIVIDLAAYEDASIIEATYLDSLRAGTTLPMPRPTRYHLEPGGQVRTEVLSEEIIELPRIDYGKHNGRPYRVVYGMGKHSVGADFFNQLIKLDVTTGQTLTWHEPGTYPGEPVYVGAPGQTGEDEGVVLSVVLDSATSRSFMLVLDAGSFTELARAELPHAVPFGFHGQFSRG